MNDVSKTEKSSDFRAGFVAIVGRPNVGKSTLLNRLIGQKISIVSSKPQTTRQSVRGVLTTDIAQYCFVDTPGWQHHKKTVLSHNMNQAIMDAFGGVDVVVFVIDAKKMQEIDNSMLLRLPTHLPVILAINKIDKLTDKSLLLPAIQKWSEAFSFAEVIPIAAEKSIQLDSLLSAIASCLPESDPVFDPDELTDQSERFFAAEFIREKVFRLLGNEVPYSAGVMIDQFIVEGHTRKIAATVIVDRPGHKGILIGKKGEKMKRIATDARKEMEKLFGGKVFLEVWVKVKPGWVDDQRTLRDITS